MENKEIIWNFLINNGLNDYGAAGLMGNLDAESALISTNLEDSYNKSLGLSDAEYTKRVDNGTYTNFAYDAAGYGLAQWSWCTRKQALLDFCKKKNKSIGDLITQLEFLLQELTTTFPAVLKTLKSATSVQQASDTVLINFEAPLNASSKKNQRAQMGLVYYNQFHNKGVNNQVMSTNTYMKDNKVKLSKDLYSTEFDCQGYGCCNQTIINPKLVEYVQKIRDHFNVPVTISSGYRCQRHNAEVGGATGSRHSMGDAADIIVQGVAPAQVAAYAESIGIKGIGLYETAKDGHFTHIDTRDYKSFWYGQGQAARSTFITGQTNTQNSTSNSATASNNSVLTIKSTGTAVKELQEKLNALGYNCSTVDGIFGQNTLNAVKKFQKEHNLDVDGIVGPATQSALNSAQKVISTGKKVKTTASLLNVREDAGTSYKIIARLPRGSEDTVTEEKFGWSKLSSGGWVSSQYLMEV